MARFTLSSELYVLPLTISELHTTCLNNQVVITWKTSGEFVNGKFIVGRSSDGTSWQPIAVIAAAGKGNQPHTYAYTDAQSFNGAYYRIEQQDVNGKATVYPMVKSSCTVSDLVSVYPNPAYGNCWLQLQSVNKTKVDMRLYDHKGALVKQLLGNAEAGLTQFDLQVGSLAQGIYSLFVYWGNGNVKTIRIVKL